MSLVYIAKAPAAFLIMPALTVAAYAFIISFAKKQGLYQISFRNSTITLREDSAMESMNCFHFDDLESVISPSPSPNPSSPRIAATSRSAG